MANIPSGNPGNHIKTLTAKDAKYGCGRLIDLARAEAVVDVKHCRPVVVVMAVEEFERLKSLTATRAQASRGSRATTKVPREAAE